MPIPILKTDRLVLRPFHRDDGPTVQRLAGDKSVASTTGSIPHPYPDGAAEEWIGTHVGAWEARNRLALAVTTEADGLVGSIGFVEFSVPHRRAEIGYWIGVPFWNHGYATEAAKALLDYGFDVLALNRIEAQYLARNPTSGRVLEKLGMKHVGVRRQHIVKGNAFEDLALCGILASDR